MRTGQDVDRNCAHLCTKVIVSNDPDGNPLNLNWIGSTPDSSLDVQDVPAFEPISTTLLLL